MGRPHPGNVFGGLYQMIVLHDKWGRRSFRNSLPFPVEGGAARAGLAVPPKAPLAEAVWPLHNNCLAFPVGGVRPDKRHNFLGIGYYRGKNQTFQPYEETKRCSKWSRYTYYKAPKL